MAYVLKRIGTTPNMPYRHFECDEINDLVTIDLYLAPMGSTCYVINTGDMYKLNGDNEWVLMPSRNTSWNDLADKPFSEIPTGGDTLTWDGNTDGLISVGPFHKVSDAVVTLSDIVSGITFVVGDNSITVAKERIEEMAPGLLFAEAVVFVEEKAVGVESYGLAFPESGIYFIAEGEADYSLTIPGYAGFPCIKKLDAKYLPDSALIPKPIPYDYMPEGYPYVGPDVIYELNQNIPADRFDENDIVGMPVCYMGIKPVEIIKGETYFATINGVVYECVADEFSIGNGALDGIEDWSGPDVPFFIYSNEYDHYILLATQPGQTSVKIERIAKKQIYSESWGGFTQDGDAGYTLRPFGGGDLTLEIGKRYSVWWDFVDYYGLVAFNDNGACAIGAPYGKTTEELPFHISVFDGRNKPVINTYLTDNSHDLAVIAIEDVVKPMDEKFLPNRGLVITYDMEKMEYTANMTFTEAYNSIISGMAPVLVSYEADYVLFIYGFNSLRSSYNPDSTFKVMRLCFNNETGQRYVNFTSDNYIYEPGES